MKKLTKFIAGITALILTFGIVGCGSKDTNYPDFKPSGDGITDVETTEKYTVNVRSAGGLKLDNVRVNAYNSSGVKVRSGISKDGVINFNLSLAAYTLEVDKETLPAGYYLEEGVTYITNPEKREEVDISIPSSVISQAATADKIYSVGEIVNDFTLEDYRSTDENRINYKLSTLLKTKKAVVLNFWYPGCTYCEQEFPFLQTAYAAAKKDVEVLGICFSTYGKKDVADFVADKKDKFELTFPLGVDPSGLQKKYSASGAPTTVVIDRYGMLAMWEEGGQPTVDFWQQLFKKYASDDYVQDVTGGAQNPGESGGSSSDNREKPNVSMPSTADMAAAASATGLVATYRADEEDEYSWPWTTTKDETRGSAITVTNTGKQNSYATVYVDVALKKEDLLSFDYYISSEENSDYLYVFLDGQLLNGDGWSGKIGWTSKDIYVADRDKTVELTFLFLKDAGDMNAELIGEDCAKIANIRTSKVSPDSNAIDVIREAASGEFGEGKYAHYEKTYLGSDGFYHVDDPDKPNTDDPLLYISLTNITPWSEQHTKNNQFTAPDGSTQFASLYDMTFNKYSETIESVGGGVASFTVKIGDKDFATPLIDYHHILDMLEKPYQLMPVTEQLKQWAEAFVSEYENELGGEAHENEWLEFCFYYNHYGKQNHGEDAVCLMNTDITEGMTIFKPFEVAFASTPNDGDSTGKIHADIKHALARPNGVYYKFTAPKNGVYHIRDYTGSQPDLTVYKMNEDNLSSTYIDSCDNVRDFDQFVEPGKYSSFSKYLILSAGETVYLNLYIAEQTMGSFEFDITYYESVDKLIDCATASGVWTYDENGTFIFLAIQEAFDQTTQRYYAAGEYNEPDLSKPIYINMIYENYFMSELQGMNYQPIEALIKSNAFATLGAAEQAAMVGYLEKAKQNTGDLYGLVEANGEIVSILNSLIAKYGGSGDNRGWMAFGCYREHFSYPAK